MQNSEPIDKTVFVLGAGFTRAFLPDAPLMVDDYDGAELARKFRGFPNASRILDWERSREVTGYINIERLLTRLDGGMPYDYGQRAIEEFQILQSEVKLAFVRRITEARNGEFFSDEMDTFAAHCLENNITCITFNYDDVLDEALWNYRRNNIASPPMWRPYDGYGFFCSSSLSGVGLSEAIGNVHSSVELLKLHGSINWYPRLGYPIPYFANAITHHERWSNYSDESRLLGLSHENIKRHLESDPFIVPPVLVKTALVEQPVLRLVWDRAYQSLLSATHVTFIGYSFPPTDIAVRTLFEETLEALPRDRIFVVNYAPETSNRSGIIQTYKNQFDRKFGARERRIPDRTFNFDGALEWSRMLSPNQLA